MAISFSRYHLQLTVTGQHQYMPGERKKSRILTSTFWSFPKNFTSMGISTEKPASFQVGKTVQPPVIHHR